MKFTSWEKAEIEHYLVSRLAELPPLIELDPSAADLWRNEIRQFETLLSKIRSIEIENI